MIGYHEDANGCAIVSKTKKNELISNQNKMVDVTFRYLIHTMKWMNGTAKS